MKGKFWTLCDYLARHNWCQTLHFINKNQILEAPRCEKECGAFLQFHGTGKLWFIIIIPKVGDLVQVTAESGQGEKWQGMQNRSLKKEGQEGGREDERDGWGKRGRKGKEQNGNYRM